MMKFIFIALMLGIIIFAGTQLIGVAHIASIFGLGETYQGCSVKTGMSVIPLMGYYQCEQLGETCDYIDIPDSWNPLDKFSTCCNVYATACEYTLVRTDGTILASAGTVNRGECVEVYKDDLIRGQRQLKRCFSPYTLYNYAPSGGRSRVYQTQFTCSIPYGTDLLKSTVLSFFDGVSSSTAKYSRTLDFDESTNYVDKWVYAPIEYNFVTHPTYGNVYCSGDGYLHKVTIIQLESGCYAIPNLNEALPKQSCCPGSISANCICNKDFKFDCTAPPQCDLLNPCPGSNYYVIDYSDPNRKTAIKYECIDGKCVSKKVISECTSNEACPTGTVCYLDPSTGIGKCQGSGEVPTVPRVPTVIGEAGWIKWLKMFITAFLVSIVILGLLVYILPLFLPMLNVLKPLKNMKMFLLATLLLSLLLLAIFAIPIAQLAEMVIK